MKVLDLQCAAGHTFEGWFGSEQDYQGQQERGLVQCPLCASAEVHKRPSAPRLNLGVGAPPPEPTASSASAAPPQEALATQRQAAWLALARRVIAQTEDVGERFASEARRMHHGEVEERAIRGQASARETAELLEEGIPVLPLLLPDAAKETLQ